MEPGVLLDYASVSVQTISLRLNLEHSRIALTVSLTQVT